MAKINESQDAAETENVSAQNGDNDFITNANFNRALGSRLKPMQVALGEISELKSMLSQVLELKSPQLQVAGHETDKSSNTKQPSQVQYEAMARKLEALEQKARMKELDSTLTGHLVERGVTDLDLAKAYIAHNKFVQHLDDELVWNDSKNGPVTLEEGLDAFFRSEKGKKLLPARAVRGTGEGTSPSSKSRFHGPKPSSSAQSKDAGLSQEDRTYNFIMGYK